MSPDCCGELTIPSVLFKSLHAPKGSCGLLPGDTAIVSIRSRDVARLKECKWVDIWMIRVGDDTILGLADTNEALRKNTLTWSPVLGAAFLLGSAFLAVMAIQSRRRRSLKTSTTAGPDITSHLPGLREILQRGGALTLPVTRRMNLGLFLILSALLSGGFLYTGISKIITYANSGLTGTLTEGIVFLGVSALVPILLIRYRISITIEYVELVAYRTNRIRFSDIQEIRFEPGDQNYTVEIISTDKMIRIPGRGTLRDHDWVVRTILIQSLPYSSIRYTGDVDGIAAVLGE